MRNVLPILFGPFATACLYGLSIFAFGTPGARENARLERDLEILSAQTLPPAQLGLLSQRQTELQQEVEEMQVRLAERGQSARRLVGDGSTTLRNMELYSRACQVLREHGVVIVEDRKLENDRQISFGKTLKDAARSLLEVAIGSGEEEEITAEYIEANLTPDMNPQEFLENERRRRRGSSDPPPRNMREIEVMADYLTLQQVISELNGRLANSILVGVDMEQPAGGGELLHWTIQLDVRPDAPPIIDYPDEEPLDPATLSAR